MQRRLIFVGLALLAWFVVPAVLMAADAPAPAVAPQGPWPPFSLPEDLKQFKFGDGYYLSTIKIVACWLLLACWVFSTDWVSRDCQERKMNFVLWNPIVFGCFAAAFILVWLIPIFFVSFPLLLIAYVAPLTTYIVQRNAGADPHEKVLTPDHFRFLFATLVNKLGGHMALEKRTAEEGPDAQLQPMGGKDDQTNQINLINARQSPGFLQGRTLLFDAVNRRADAVRLDLAPRATAVQYQIDGMWHNYSRQETEQADMMLAVFKMLSNLNAEERVKRQAGTFGAVVAGAKFRCKIVTQGVETGEVSIIQLEAKIDAKKAPIKSLEALGMRPKMIEQLLAALNQPSGLFVVSAPPSGGGLTSAFEGVIDGMDRYMRNFAAVEDVNKPERDIENVAVTTYNGAAGETPATVLPKLIRTYPDVFVVRDLVNLETLDILCDQAKNENRMSLTSVRAKEAIEALLRIMTLKIDPQKFASVVVGSLNVRLVRKLCDKCKEAYAPPAELLKQLGLPPDKLEAIYRPPSPPAQGEKVEICQQCLGIGYYGRTGIFELLLPEEEFRAALATTPRLDALRAVARKNKFRTLHEEGLLLLAKGVTSVPELARVLKG